MRTVGGSRTYPYGSTGAVRAHVLAALGVLKVASADQIRRLMCPGHKDNKAVRNACLDLAKHGLTVSEGSARDGNKLWGLTPLGLDAAAEVLARPVSEMGGTARGAARSGAPHAMAVNETIIAITRTAPEPTRPVLRTAVAAPPPETVSAPGPAGIGTVASWSTEVVHHLSGSGRSRATVQTDAVLLAPEAGVPVLLVEVDNCTETPERLAAKFDRYRDFFRRKTKSAQGREIPAWRTLYPPTGREGHPPIAVVFNPGVRTGDQALKNRMNRVLDLARDVWSPRFERMSGLSEPDDGYQNYMDAIPLLFTTLPRLQEAGPLDAVWWRCGHRQWETLTTALTNPDDHDVWMQRGEERRRQREERGERERRERAQQQSQEWAARPPSAPVPEQPPAPCERCGRPVTGALGLGYEDAPPEDGRHCPECRMDLARPSSPGLLKALFTRPPVR